jgi:hypothetical protein
VVRAARIALVVIRNAVNQIVDCASQDKSSAYRPRNERHDTCVSLIYHLVNAVVINAIRFVQAFRNQFLGQRTQPIVMVARVLQDLKALFGAVGISPDW